MKYCKECEAALADDAIVCPYCGCRVKENADEPVEEKDTSATKSAVILGIVGILTAFLFAVAGHITSIIAITKGTRDAKAGRKKTGLILGIIGEICSIISSIMGIIYAVELASELL